MILAGYLRNKKYACKPRASGDDPIERYAGVDGDE